MWKKIIAGTLFCYIFVVDGFITLSSISKRNHLSIRLKNAGQSTSLPPIRFWQLHVNPSEIAECSESLQSVDEVDINAKSVEIAISVENPSSKREMLRFAIPALGIYLCNPLLSNIDNAFVGRTVGTAGLAALSPATICTDQMLYMFSFIGRATTGIVSRAYSSSKSNTETEEGRTKGNTKAARDAAAARKFMVVHIFVLHLLIVSQLLSLKFYFGKALTVSIMCGICVSLFYAFFTPNMLSALNVSPYLRPDASAYIYWRGIIASAALAQSVCLSVMMATRDALTPLKIVGLAALVNVFADAALCVWPFRLGCAGAAAATSFSTLFSCGFMLKALAKKQILPEIRIPTKLELRGLLDYTGPLFAITLTRLGGFVAMQRSAMILGHQSLAGYQVCVNLLIFFLLFGEPLSQLSQTKLPGLLDKQDDKSIRATLKSISVFAAITSIGIASITYAAAMFGSGLFSTDIVVQQIAQKAAPSLFAAVGLAILGVAVDGTNMASRDFMFMLIMGLATFIVQLLMLPHCKSVAAILSTYSVRLGMYAIASVYRILSGSGEVGRSLKKKSLA